MTRPSRLLRAAHLVLARARRALPIFALCLTCAWLALSFGARRSLAQPAGLGSAAARRFPEMPGTPPASPSAPGSIRLTTEDGERGPVVLSPKKGALTGEFIVWNDGAGPLHVSRVALRTDLDDPRLPTHVNVRFTDGSAGGTVIQPHSSKRVAITWAPEAESKLRQAIGHVVLTSTDEVAGETAMAFVATVRGPASFLTTHLLTWLLLLPALGGLVALLMHIVGYRESEQLRGVALGTSGLQCVLALVLYMTFNGAVTRVEGNDGFQFVERTVMLRGLAVEYFVGVDGTSVSLVLLTAIVGFVAVVASWGVQTERLRAHYGLLSLLLAAVMGIFVSLDLCLFTASWVVMLAALVGLVALATDSAGHRGPAGRLTVYAALSVACLLFAVDALHRHSDPTFLADGTRSMHSFAIPELMRVAYNAKHLTLFGYSWVKVVWGALFVAFAVMVPLVPLHRWFVGVVGETSGPATPVALVVAAVVVKTGVYGLMRVSLAILPDGSRWAAATVVALGVVNVVYGALSAVFAKDLRRVVGWATVAQVGFCLVGLGSMTREGLAGCLIQMSSHGLVVALLLFLVGALHDRARTSELARLGGLGGPMPLFTAFAGVAMLASAGVPGLPGFWGEILPVFGAFPAERLLAVGAGAGGVAIAFAFMLAARRVFSGPATEGGLAELGPREVAAVTPLLVLCLALGLFPASFFSLVQGGVSDLNQLVNPPGPDEIA